jgi:transposase-like protein
MATQRRPKEFLRWKRLFQSRQSAPGRINPCDRAAASHSVQQFLRFKNRQYTSSIWLNSSGFRPKQSNLCDFGELPIEIPRDRTGTFEPQIVTKHQTRWSGFDDKILSLYARGMTVREIQSHLQEMYDAEVSPTLISSVTDAVLDEVKTWQSRPLALSSSNSQAWVDENSLRCRNRAPSSIDS